MLFPMEPSAVPGLLSSALLVDARPSASWSIGLPLRQPARRRYPDSAWHAAEAALAAGLAAVALPSAASRRRVREPRCGHVVLAGNSPAEGAAIGIDFGTSNSAVAVRQADGRFVLVPPEGMPSGRPLLPSIVAYNSNGAVLAGGDALKVKPSSSQVVFRSVKRLMGRTYEECHQAGVDPNKLGADPSGKAKELVRLLLPDGETLMPEQVAAVIMDTLKSIAEKFLGQRVTKAVIGVPARFDQNQRRAVEYAAELAGFQSVRLIPEPELAVRAYSLKMRTPPPAAGDEDLVRHILVVDLGGGTFDVCIIRHFLSSDEIHLLFTAGKETLGGDDFDEAIVNWSSTLLKPHLMRPEVGAWPLSTENLRRLRLVARRAKEKLSSVEKVEISFAGGNVPLSRAQFEDLALPILRKMLKPVREACFGANITLPNDRLVSEIVENTRMKRSRHQPRIKGSVENWEMRRNQSARDLRREWQDEKNEKKKMLRDAAKGTVEEEEITLDEVLLVGAATWMPSMREMILLITNVEPTASQFDPEAAVALGAAALAHIVDEGKPDVQVQSAWKVAWAEYLTKRPDLLQKLQEERGGTADPNEDLMRELEESRQELQEEEEPKRRPRVAARRR